MAVVTSTGFLTAKGSLVSSIMYPPPADFRFERDSYKFIGFLAFLASIGFTYSMVQKVSTTKKIRYNLKLIKIVSRLKMAIQVYYRAHFIVFSINNPINGDTGLQVIMHTFDLITVCVPPALPAAMAAGIILAQRRLQLRNIFCISPRAINVSGNDAFNWLHNKRRKQFKFMFYAI